MHMGDECYRCGNERFYKEGCYRQEKLLAAQAAELDELRRAITGVQSAWDRVRASHFDWHDRTPDEHCTICGMHEALDAAIAAKQEKRG